MSSEVMILLTESVCQSHRNILEIDLEAMRVRLKHPAGALLLFDFSAAFPSIDQSFMIDTLDHLGLPSSIFNVVKALYY